MPNDPSDTLVMERELQGAARVGAELRGVREQLGWRLDEVAEGLRIRQPYLEAIERGELSALPGAAYQTGFVRTYSQALGLDPEEILRRFRAAGVGVAEKSKLAFLAPVPDRGVPTGALVLLGVFLLLGGYGLWYRHTATEHRLASAVPDVPAELAPLAVPKVATVTPPKPAPQTSPSAPATQTATTAPAAASAPGMATGTPALPAGQASTQTVSNADSGTAAPASPASTTPATAPTTTTPASPTAGRTITSTGDSWVEVRDSTGSILFSRVLHAGESWPIPDEAGLTMTAGNAGATEIVDNGKAGPPLGSNGAVVRNYALTSTGALPPGSAQN